LGARTFSSPAKGFILLKVLTLSEYMDFPFNLKRMENEMKKIGFISLVMNIPKDFPRDKILVKLLE
jgi:hypothetical protein